jgi:hypothetical protein
MSGYFINPKRSGTTRTWLLAGRKKSASNDPVRYLREVDRGQVIRLDGFRFERDGLCWLSVGRDTGEDIVVLGDGTVSELQCFLALDRETSRVYCIDASSKNGTFVDDVYAQRGLVEVQAGARLMMGRETTFLACGRAGDAQKRRVTATTPEEFYRNAVTVYGSQRKVCKALEISRRTYARRLADAGLDDAGPNAGLDDAGPNAGLDGAWLGESEG